MYKDKILGLLRSSRDRFLSGEELARKCGISRTMVWKHIKSLENEGFIIEAVSSQGYRIVSVPDSLRAGDIKSGLGTRTVGREIHLLAETASTNTDAMKMASDGAPEGALVIAETQAGGKGRLGRKWISPRGNLYLSVILRPNFSLPKAPLVTLLGAVAVASAVRNFLEADARIKWPNDILISGRKIGGLLTEMSAEQDRIRHIVLGIGLNVNMPLDELPSELRPLTTTLAAEAGRRIDRTALLRGLLRSLDHWYAAFLTDETIVLDEWKSLNMTIGSRVSVRGLNETIAGRAAGIDGEGRLIVAGDDGINRVVAAGDVTIEKTTD
jgi:BirA family transcriptional regulator, biotin operon repressor / biotin---[acetyl-CoA-carboxylase] ligase